MVVLWKILREKYNKMGDQSLIRGAALAAPKFNDIGAAGKEGVSGISEFILARNAEKRQEERAQKAKVETYLNNMPSGIELSKIPPAQQENVANWSKQMKFEYAEAARVLPSLDPGSDEYIEAVNKMTSVKQAFSNLNNNLETHKANKTEYLKSSSSGALSKGNNSKQGNMLANIYTDEADMIFDVNGNMAFQSGEQVLNLNDVPDYFNKDFKSADTLININSDIYNSGQKLDPTMSNMYRQKILNMIRQGGRETTLSLATDDLIQEGGLGIVDEDLLYNPERQEELEQTVVENYMNILNSSANAGYNKKQAAIKKSSKSASNKRQNVYGQNIDNELEIYGQDAQNIYRSIINSLDDLDKTDIRVNDSKGTRIQQKADAINKIILSFNKNAYELLVDKDNVVYVNDGEDDFDPGIDFQDKTSIADYVLEQIAEEGDINPDTARLIRNRLLSSKTQGSTSNPINLTQEEKDAMF